MVWKAATLLLLLAGCNRRESGGSVAEPYLPDEASVAFALEPLQGGNGSQQWIRHLRITGENSEIQN